jgi:hypothetical protein
MLNMLSDLETAAAQAGTDARMPFGSDACLPSGGAATTQMHEGFVVYVRPRAYWAADVSRQRRLAAGLAALALGQPNPSKQYPHTTRIAVSGGAKGPHPWREPEPA